MACFALSRLIMLEQKLESNRLSIPEDTTHIRNALNLYILGKTMQIILLKISVQWFVVLYNSIRSLSCIMIGFKNGVPKSEIV